MELAKVLHPADIFHDGQRDVWVEEPTWWMTETGISCQLNPLFHSGRSLMEKCVESGRPRFKTLRLSSEGSRHAG